LNALLHGSWRAALIIALGVMAALGFRPLGLWPAMLLGWGRWSGWWRAPSWHRAALIGWLWGVGHFSVGNSWIAPAFTYQAKMPGWLGGIAVVLLSLYLAVFPALAAGASWFVRRAAGAGAGLCGGVDRQRMVAFMAVHRLCVESAGRGAAGR
jgi:apolipoprotein N-acyltransferase